MVTSNMALQWINYLTQVVGKAAKPIRVMLLGVLLGKKSYPIRKYLFVFLIVFGVIIFMFKDQEKKERIKSVSAPTAYSMMRNTNLWGSLISMTGVILSGELFKFIYFVGLYSEVMIYIGCLALMGALGQLFIFLMVSGFGPLPCSVVTTTRKFFTVLASVILFGNVLLLRQWFGAILVFSGLFLDIFHSKSKSLPPKRVANK